MQFFVAKKGQYTATTKKLNCSTASTDNPRAIFGSHRLFIDDETSSLTFLIDSGADVSVIPHNLFGKVTKQTENKLVAANGSPIPTYGTKLIQVSLGLRRVFTHCFILAAVNRPIIGADFLARNGLLIDLKKRCLIDPTTQQQAKATIAIVSTPTPKNFQIEANIFGEILKDYPVLLEPPDYTKPVRHTVRHYIATKGPLQDFSNS